MEHQTTLEAPVERPLTIQASGRSPLASILSDLAEVGVFPVPVPDADRGGVTADTVMHVSVTPEAWGTLPRALARSAAAHGLHLVQVLPYRRDGLSFVLRRPAERGASGWLTPEWLTLRARPLTGTAGRATLRDCLGWVKSNSPPGQEGLGVVKAVASRRNPVLLERSGSTSSPFPSGTWRFGDSPCPGGELLRAVTKQPLSARSWWPWLAHPAGLQVAVLGPDGSGKSTLIEGLRGALAPAFERVLCAHFRPGLERRRKTYRPEADPHGRPPRSAVSSVLKLGFYAADHVAGYVLGTAPARARGALVLYDRHFADLEIDPRRYRYGGPPVLLGATRRLIPQPDLTLILDAPADVIQRRRQEVTPAESARQVAAYRALARRVPRTCLIDAGRPPDQVLRQTAEVVVARVAAQTARRLGL